MKIIDKKILEQIKSLISGFSIALGARFIGMILGFIVTVYIVREFGAAIFGNYTIFVSTAIVLATLCRRGWDILLLKLSANENISDNYLNTTISVTIFECLKTLVILSSIYLFFFILTLSNLSINFVLPQNSLKVLLAAPLLIITAITIELMRGINKLIISEFLKTILPALSILIILSISGFFKPDVDIINIYLLSLFASASIAIFFLFKDSKPSIKLIKNKEHVNLKKHNERASFERIVITNLASSYFAILVLGAFGAPEEVGFFALALRIIALFNIPLIAADVKLAPLMAKNSKDLRVVRPILKFSMLSLGSIVFISFIITFFALEYMPVIFGSEFIESSPLILIMFTGLFFQAIFLPYGNFLRMGGFAKINERVSIFSMIVSSLFGIFLIFNYAALGAAITFCLSHIIAGIGNFYFYKNLPIHKSLSL